MIRVIKEFDKQTHHFKWLFCYGDKINVQCQCLSLHVWYYSLHLRLVLKKKMITCLKWRSFIIWGAWMWHWKVLSSWVLVEIKVECWHQRKAGGLGGHQSFIIWLLGLRYSTINPLWPNRHPHLHTFLFFPRQEETPPQQWNRNKMDFCQSRWASSSLWTVCAVIKALWWREASVWLPAEQTDKSERAGDGEVPTARLLRQVAWCCLKCKTDPSDSLLWRRQWN